MIAYGYGIDSEKEVPELMRECTYKCTVEELDLLIDFLGKIKDDIADNSELCNGTHWHYRDFNKKWDNSQADLIITLKDEKINR